MRLECMRGEVCAALAACTALAACATLAASAARKARTHLQWSQMPQLLPVAERCGGGGKGAGIQLSSPCCAGNKHCAATTHQSSKLAPPYHICRLSSSLLLLSSESSGPGKSARPRVLEEPQQIPWILQIPPHSLAEAVVQGLALALPAEVVGLQEQTKATQSTKVSPH